MAVDPHIASVVLLCGFEGADGSTAFVDQAKGKTITAVGNAQLDTAQFKFGTSSLLLDGTGDYLSIADHADWDLGANQFTIECWVRPGAGWTGSETLVSQWGSASAWTLFVDGGSLKWWFFDVTSSLRQIAVAWTPTPGTWYHVAVDRDATKKIRLYVNGAMVTSFTFTDAVRASSDPLLIGALGNFIGTYDLDGHIDEVRITNGVARYASDGGFAVPTAAYPRPGDLPDAPAVGPTTTGGSAFWDQEYDGREYDSSRKRRKRFLEERARRVREL